MNVKIFGKNVLSNIHFSNVMRSKPSLDKNCEYFHVGLRSDMLVEHNNKYQNILNLIMQLLLEMLNRKHFKGKFSLILKFQVDYYSHLDLDQAA